MKAGKDSSRKLASWGNSLLNKLSAITRNRRKRDASKKRRELAKQEVGQELDAVKPLPERD